MLNPQNELIEMFYSVIAVTDNFSDAEVTAEMFLKGFGPEDRKAILTELENRDSRFLGWDSQYTFFYSIKNMSGDALYVSRKVSALVRSGDFDIRLTLTRRL